MQKVQELAQKATAMAKDVYSRARESEALRQARCPRTPPALSLSLSPSPREPGQVSTLTPRSPALQAVAVGQRGAGEAAAGVAQGAAGGAAEEESGCVASPGTARGLSGLGTPRLPPAVVVLSIKRS